MSSTKDDLVAHRRAVLEAIGRLEHQAVAMEDYTSADQTPLDKCLADVARCGLYVGVFAHRYGYVPPGEQYCITELEYRKAKECRIPTLVFVVDPDFPWPPRAMERGEGELKLEALKSELQRERLLAFFTTPEDLASKVTAAISMVGQSDGGGSRPQGKPWQIPDCTHDFADRKVETKLLVEALQSDQAQCAVIHGLPGCGKSELARRVAERLRERLPDGAFYCDLRGNEAAGDRPGSDAVMRHVILSIDPKAPVAADPSVLAGQYHSLLSERKTLLVLDNAHDFAQIKPLVPPQTEPADRHVSARRQSAGKCFGPVGTVRP